MSTFRGLRGRFEIPEALAEGYRSKHISRVPVSGTARNLTSGVLQFRMDNGSSTDLTSPFVRRYSMMLSAVAW